VGEQIDFTDEGRREIIHSFTREAGVRNLEREIATITRKQARRIAEDQIEKMTVTPEVVREFLGVPKFRTERKSMGNASRGLAWLSDSSGHRWAATSSSSKPRAMRGASSSP